MLDPKYEPTEIKYQNEDFLKDLDLSLSSKIQLLRPTKQTTVDKLVSYSR